MSIQDGEHAHFLLPSSSLIDVNAPVQPHLLCERCQTIYRESKHLEDISRWVAEEEEEHLNREKDGGSGKDKHCKKSAASVETRYEFFRHHISDSDLIASAVDGCHLCTLFCQQRRTGPIYSTVPNAESENVDERNYSSNRNADVSLETCHGPQEASAGIKAMGFVACLSYETSSYPKFGSRAHLALLKQCMNGCIDENPIVHSLLKLCSPSKLARNTGYAIRADTAPTAISISTASAATFALALKWIDKCVNNHADCQRDNHPSSHVLPTRLIDVGPEDGVQRPCLYFPSSQDLNLSYLTLSHCWGGAKIYTLNSATFHELIHGVVLSKLPQTFQDAIQICRRLKQRYLWIDSLCIQQDSQEDWQKESAIMGLIYQNSHCTIAAVSRENSQAGCYKQRNPLAGMPCWISRNPALAAYIDGHDYNPGHSQQPLHSRGWVLQERLLSRRTLGFTNSGVFWDCRQCMASEEYPYQVPTESLAQDDIHLKKAFSGLRLTLLVEPASQDYVHQFLRSWHDMIRVYTKLNFTYPSDKPVAFSGIGADAQRRSGLTYYYGLWKEYILQDLLWYIPYPYSTRPFVETVSKVDGGWFYRCNRRSPSFSWISSDVRVDYHASFLRHSYNQLKRPSLNDFVGSGVLCVPRVIDGKYYMEEYELDILNEEDENGNLRLTKTNHIMAEIGATEPIPDTVEYRTRAIYIHSPSAVEESNPYIVLRGPVLRFKTKKIRRVSGRSQWSHPYDGVERVAPGAIGPTVSHATGGHTSETSTVRYCSSDNGFLEIDSRCNYRWFYPDVNLFESCPDGWDLDVVCLVIARWYRNFGGLFYAAGLVLTKWNGVVARDSQGKVVDVYNRIGYFEYAWDKRHVYWDEDGSLEQIVLT